MLINNSVEFNICDFKVQTTLDLEWIMLSNGNYVAIDRGVSADQYNCEITTYGKEDLVNSICDVLDDSINTNASLTLTNFVSNGKIFGENVDYTGILSATCTDYGTRESNSWKGFKLTISLRLLNPTFNATAVLPDFSTACIGAGYQSDINRFINAYDTYFGSYYVNQNKIDSGKFIGTFNFTSTELANLREYMRVNRDVIIPIASLNGITHMFGPSGGDYTHNTKLIELQEDKQFGINRWLCKLKFVKNY